MENVADLMAARLDTQTLAAARSVSEAAEAVGVQTFLVGGSVRDLLIGRDAIVDLDISLVGSDSQTFDRIAVVTGGTVSRRSQFTTAKLHLDDLEIDLAMARAEEYPLPGSLPVVRSGTLTEDLARRDFSVNAMAVSLSQNSWGDLFDAHRGLIDLERQSLRVLHSASFRDDPTRMLRAARYSSRLELKPTPETLDALLTSVMYLDRVTAARVRNELERALAESDPAGSMRLLCEWGVLSAIHPSLTFHAGKWKRFAAEAGEMSPRERTAVAYAVLAHGLPDTDANGVVARLNPEAYPRRAIRESAALGRLAASELTGCTNSQLATVLDAFTDAAVFGASLATSSKLGSRLAEYLRGHRDLRPHLTGDDLIELGLRQGPSVGGVLALLRNAWLDDEISSPDEERALAEKLIGDSEED